MELLIEQVRAELSRAQGLFPEWPTDPLHALAVLGEEFGELTKAVLQNTYEPHKSTPEKIRMEAIQTAAMALRFAASLGAYVHTKSPQHDIAKVEGQGADLLELWRTDRDRYYAEGGIHPCYD